MERADFNKLMQRLSNQFYKADVPDGTRELYFEKLQRWDAERLRRAVETIIDRSDGRSVFDWPTIGEIYAAAPKQPENKPADPRPKRTADEIKEVGDFVDNFLSKFQATANKGS